MTNEHAEKYPIVRANEFEGADDYLRRFAWEKDALIKIAGLCMEIDINEYKKVNLQLRDGEETQLRRKVQNLENYIRDVQKSTSIEQWLQDIQIEDGDTCDKTNGQVTYQLDKIFNQQVRAIKIIQQKDPNGFNVIEQQDELLKTMVRFRGEGCVEEAIMIADYMLLVYYANKCEKRMTPQEIESATVQIRAIYARVYKRLYDRLIVKDNNKMSDSSTIWKLRRELQKAQRSLEYTKESIEEEKTPPAMKAEIITEACQVIKQYCNELSAALNGTGEEYREAISVLENEINYYYTICKQNPYLINKPSQQRQEFRKARNWLTQIVAVGMNIAGVLELQRTQEDQERNKRAAITQQSVSTRHTAIQQLLKALQQEIQHETKKMREQVEEYVLDRAVEIEKKLKNPELFEPLGLKETPRSCTYKLGAIISRTGKIFTTEMYIFFNNNVAEERISGGAFVEKLVLRIEDDANRKNCTMEYTRTTISNGVIMLLVQYNAITGTLEKIDWRKSYKGLGKAEAKWYKVEESIQEISPALQNPRKIQKDNQLQDGTPIASEDTVEIQAGEATLRFPRQLNPEALKQAISQGTNPFINEIPFQNLYVRTFPDLIGLTQ